MKITKNIFFIVLTLITITAYSQIDSLEKETIYSWQLNHYDFSTEYVELDTSLNSFQNFNPLLQKTISVNYLGNLGSASQSKIYYDRKKYKTGFIFSDPYGIYFNLPENQKYFNTKRQFTLLNYSNSGPKDESEQLMRVFHTQNVNKDLNFGFDYNLISSDGRYQNQQVRQNRINLFLSYKKKQYQIHTCFNSNRVKAQENGGIDSLHYLGSSEYSDRKNIPVRLNDASSQVFNTSFYLVQEYQIGKSVNEVRTVSSEASKGVGSKPLSGKGINIVRDTLNISRENNFNDTLSAGVGKKMNSMSDSLTESVTMDTVKVFKMSGLSISHEMIYNSNVRKFFDDNIDEYFYSDLDIFLDSLKTRDATGQKQFGNKFSLHYKYLEKFSFKLSFFNEYDIYEFSDTIHELNSTGLQDTVIRIEKSKTTGNNSVSLYLRAKLFNRFSFNGIGEYYISGFKKGNSLGNLGISWSLFNNTEIRLNGRYENSRPDYYYHNFTSNNFIWHNNNLRRIEKWNSEFLIRNRKINMELGVQYGQISNYIYLDQTAYINQYYGKVNIISAELSEKIKLGPVHSFTRFVYQKSSNDSILSLPDINLYQSLYYEHLTKFKSTGGELFWQFGVDYRYSGGYFADGYMPVSGLFYRQYDHKLSDFHCMDVFINLMIKRARFYIKYNYLNSVISESYFFTGPYYPSPQPVFKFGLAWTFYD